MKPAGILAGADAAPTAEDQLQRMRKKVYALSSEVAHLTRERDILRVQIGQPPGPTLPAGRSVEIVAAGIAFTCSHIHPSVTTIII